LALLLALSRLCSLKLHAEAHWDKGFILVVFSFQSDRYHQAENVSGILREVLISMQRADVESSGGPSEIPTNVLVLNHPT
jgi:hypothetical protein